MWHCVAAFFSAAAPHQPLHPASCCLQPNAEPLVLERVPSDTEARQGGPTSWIHTKVGVGGRVDGWEGQTGGRAVRRWPAAPAASQFMWNGIQHARETAAGGWVGVVEGWVAGGLGAVLGGTSVGVPPCRLRGLVRLAGPGHTCRPPAAHPSPLPSHVPQALYRLSESSREVIKGCTPDMCQVGAEGRA